MRLRFRPDVFAAPTSDGVYLLTHHGPVVLTGAAVAAWVERLAAALAQGQEFSVLTAGLAPDRRAMLGSLVAALIERRVLDQPDDPDDPDVPAALPPGDPGDQRALLAFLDTFGPRPAARLAGLARRRCVVVGGGPLAPMLAGACQRAGLARAAAASDARCLEDLTPADVAIWIEDEASTAGPAGPAGPAGWAVLRERGPLVAMARVTGGAAWLGPLVAAPAGYVRPPRVPGPGTAAPALAARPAQSARPGPADQENDSDGDGDAGLQLAAAQLAHRLMGRLTGVDGADRDSVVTRLDLSALTSDEHAAVPHPFDWPAAAPAPEAFLRGVGALIRGAECDRETFSRHAAACIGPLTGILTELSEAGYAQAPLHVTRAVLASSATVTGTGTTFDGARHEAAVRGLAACAAAAADPRRMLHPDSTPLTVTDPEATLAEIRSGRTAARVHAYRLADGGAVLVDAAGVFTGLAGDPAADPLPPGTAGGYSWEQAVLAGLLDWCRQHCVRALDAADSAPRRPELPAVRLGDLDLDAGADRSLALLDAARWPVTAVDLTAVTGVPAAAVAVAGRTVGCAAGVSLAGAAGSGLHEALLRQQSELSQEPAYAPAPLPPVRCSPPGRGGAAADGSTGPGPARRQAAGASHPLRVGDIVAILGQRGMRPLVVPLDHAPEVTRVLPYLVRVLVPT